MRGEFKLHENEVNSAFARWEGLRRRLYERECVWASTVTLTGDPARLHPLRRELVHLRQEADSAFSVAINMLEAPEKLTRS